MGSTGDKSDGEEFTKHKGRDYEEGGLGEAGGYTAQGTEQGLRGEGNVSNPQELTEGDKVSSASQDTGMSFKDLSGGGVGSIKELAGGAVGSIKELAGGKTSGFSDLTGGDTGGVDDLRGGETGGIKDLTGG